MVAASFALGTYPLPLLAYERNEFSGRPVVLVAVVDAAATVYGIFATTVAIAASVAAVGRRLSPVFRRASPVSAANILATVCIFSVVVICVVGWLLGAAMVA